MIDQVVQIARRAGVEILRIYQSAVEVEYKEDDSPLTRADSASHQLIVAALKELTPEIPILSEESETGSGVDRMKWKRFWLVDPLDGTKEFIKKTGEFTVNIALIENQEPVLGVVYAPAIQVTYFAEKGGTALRSEKEKASYPIHTRSADTARLCVVASKDHAGPQVAAMLEKIPNADLASMGSSLKFCLVAEGKADLYPRFVPTMEWDTAAAQCVLETAGGKVTDLAGNRLGYQKEVLRNPSIMAFGDLDLNWRQFLS